jgi:hypothetical protein
MIATLSIGAAACVRASSGPQPYYAVVVAINSPPDVLDAIHVAFLTVRGLNVKAAGKPDSGGNVYYEARGPQSGALIRVAEYHGKLIDSETGFGYRLLIGTEGNGAAERADIDRLVDDVRRAIAAAAGGAKIMIQRDVDLTP